jgi:hypothetical protein
MTQAGQLSPLEERQRIHKSHAARDNLPREFLYIKPELYSIPQNGGLFNRFPRANYFLLAAIDFSCNLTRPCESSLRPLFSSAAVCFACSAHGNAAAAMSAERRISLRQLIRDESTPLSSRQTKQKLQQCAVMERGNEFAESIFL